MAVKVFIDKIETLEMREKWGVVENVVRRALVKGLSGTDFKVMYSALEAAGIPQKGQYLDSDKGTIEKYIDLLEKSYIIFSIPCAVSSS